jgi:L-ascorbate metabolism protein UlaG (beta-lactamase superfamily)
MSVGVDAQRRSCAITVLGGSTTVVDIAGRRIVMDPTFDPPGVHAYLTKTAGPAASADALGSVDAILISHDQHPDNLDDDGRRLALAAPLVLTHPGAAGRLGPPAVGLQPWQSYDLPDGSGPLAVQAVPAVHGPADGQRDASGHINCEVSGFVLSGPGLPTVYLSGDNASIRAVKDVADRVGDIDIAVLFAGAASVPTKENGQPLTLTAARAAAAAEVLGAKVVIPAHVDGWAHFSEGVDEFVAAFDEAGVSSLLRVAAHSEWIDWIDPAAAKGPAQSQASLHAELRVHPIGRAPLFESAEAFSGLRVAQTAGHADAVIQAEKVVDAGLDDSTGTWCSSTALRKQISRRGEQTVVGHHSGHQTPVEGFGRAEHPSGEHEVPCAYRPDETDEHLAVIRVGVAAEQLGHAEGRPLTHH